MKKLRILVPIVTVFVVAVSALPASAFPSSVADTGVDMVDGPRADDIAEVGSQTWMGDKFDRVLDDRGSPLAPADGLTVLSLEKYVPRMRR